MKKTRWMQKATWVKRAAAAALGLGLAAAAAGCAGLGMTSHELELLESSAADAGFMDRTWADHTEAERREFAHANADSWGYFNDLGAQFLQELRARLGDPATSDPLVRRLAPALNRLTDQLIIAACDRLARNEMTGFFEAMLAGLTEAERTAWREQTAAQWHQAATERWSAQQEWRQAVLETILFVKALALA